MALYLQFEGISGDVTAAGSEKWIECTSFKWSGSRFIDTVVGTAGNRESGHPGFEPFIVTKNSDSATTSLLNEFHSGKKGKKAKFRVTATAGKIVEEYTFENTLISDFRMNNSGDRTTETFCLDFAKWEHKQVSSGNDHNSLSPKITSFDKSTSAAAG